ncbi:MAG: RecB family exonuclease, partial [uncultured Frankineae bacterium]
GGRDPRRAPAARARGDAAAPVRLHPLAADDLAGLPAPLPADLPRAPARGARERLGAQDAGRSGARRAGPVVVRAARTTHAADRPDAPRARLAPGRRSARRLRRRRAVGAVAGPRRGDGRALRRDARPGRRAGGRRTHRLDAHGRARPQRPGRPARPAGRRAGGRRLQDRPYARRGRRRPRLPDPRAVRAGRRPHPARPVHPRRAAPPADRTGRRARPQRRLAGRPPRAGGVARRPGHVGHRGRGGGHRCRPGVPAAHVLDLRLVRLPARVPCRSGRRGCSAPPVGRARRRTADLRRGGV